jgi:hypothetical protein
MWSLTVTMTAYLVCDEPSASTTREPLTGRSQLAPLGCRNRPIGANGTLCAAAEFARTRPWHTRITQIQIGSAQASSASTPRYRPSAKPPCQPVSQSPGLRQPGSQLGRSRSGRSRSGGVGQAAKRSRSQEVRKSGSQEVRKSGSLPAINLSPQRSIPLPSNIEVARPSAQKHINHLNDFTAYANILFAVTESSSVGVN